MYLLTATLFSILVIHTTYNKEIDHAINNNLVVSKERVSYVKMYLDILSRNNSDLSEKDLSRAIIDTFSESDSNYIVLNKEGVLASSESAVVEEALNSLDIKERTYMLLETEVFTLNIHDAVSFKGNSYSLIYQVSLDYIKEMSWNQFYSFLLVSSIGMVLMFLFVMPISNLILKPVLQLKEAAKAIASGQSTSELNQDRKDEIGDLIRQFIKMREVIEEKINDISEESQRKQLFLDHLTHEIKTPITAIKGYSDLIMRMELKDQLLFKSVHFINKESNRLETLSQALTDMLLVKEKTPLFTPMYIRDLIEQVVISITPRLEEMQCKCLLLGDDFCISANGDLLHLVFLNLLENSLRASKVNDEIRIVIGQDHVVVEDNGHGISEKDLEHIMNPFYRVEYARDRKTGGVGLGLTLVKRIMEVHGGEVSIHCRDNKTFATVGFNLQE